MDSYIRYAGFPGNMPNNWKAIPDTEEEIEKAIKDGYIALSIMSFEFEHGKNLANEPNRKGSLILDIDCKDDQAQGINAGKNIALALIRGFHINPDYLKYWISGGKGCHIEIPAELMGAEDGDQNLPLIYKLMINLLKDKMPNLVLQFNLIDMQMYCMGRSKLLRVENVMRDNGRYKVPVTADEFLNKDSEELIELTKSPRKIETINKATIQTNDKLQRFFSYSKNLFYLKKDNDYPIKVLNDLLKCSFLKHCYLDSQSLSEPEWFCMIAILSRYGDIGKILIHLFSSDYEEYSC